MTVTVAIPYTADVVLVLKTPSENGITNHISITGSGAARTSAVNVVNCAAIAVLTRSKILGQAVAIRWTNAANVVAAGTGTAPTYKIETSSVSVGGGSKVLTLTAS